MAVDRDRAIAAFNARVDGLDRLWARVTLVIEGAGADGSTFREQAEGHLQIERPNHVALSLGKLGDERLYLGSNAERYWWLDRLDPDARIAFVGAHDAVTDAKLDRLGFPLRPLDLVELLAIRPIDPASVTRAFPGADGTVGVTVRRPGGAAVIVTIDPDAGEATSVVVQRDGVQRAMAVLSRPRTAPVIDDTRIRASVSTRFDITSPVFDGVAVLRLYEPKNKAIKPIAFDPDRLIRGYRIRDVIDLDEEAMP